MLGTPNGTMILDQAQSVGRILNEYISVHNELFGGGLLRSLRRLVPLAGFFQAINFTEQARRLGILSIQLEALRTQIGIDGAPEQLAIPFASYSEALLPDHKEACVDLRAARQAARLS